ncbi:DgyrCDS9598 [Dimorphilus gyrociliatus]|uniref:DgyrCDS9598 n=1 Tax=Dimorphilus gyrociliatus TaxID=2664684 RepID=A0A7I8VZN3_9ANNE|nr:DgyrCDS9598 [Dimorphilus gyrociliatus]
MNLCNNNRNTEIRTTKEDKPSRIIDRCQDCDKEENCSEIEHWMQMVLKGFRRLRLRGIVRVAFDQLIKEISPRSTLQVDERELELLESGISEAIKKNHVVKIKQGEGKLYKLSNAHELECDMIMIEGSDTGSEEERRPNKENKVELKFEIIKMKDIFQDSNWNFCPNVSLTSNIPPTIRQHPLLTELFSKLIHSSPRNIQDALPMAILFESESKKSPLSSILRYLYKFYKFQSKHRERVENILSRLVDESILEFTNDEMYRIVDLDNDSQTKIKLIKYVFNAIMATQNAMANIRDVKKFITGKWPYIEQDFDDGIDLARLIGLIK